MNQNNMSPNNQGRILPLGAFRMNRFAGTAALAMLLLSGLQARPWTNTDGSKTFEGELKSFDPATGTVSVTQPNGTVLNFNQNKLSAADIAFLKEQGNKVALSTDKPLVAKSETAPGGLLQKSDGKPADMTKPVKVFVMMGQSNMVGMGKVGPETTNGTLEYYCKTEKKYPFLIDDAGKWVVRNDVRCAMVTCNKHCDWLQPGFGAGNKIGTELGFGHVVGNLFDAPVLLVKACIGNRSLGWDLLPPGSERYEADGMIYAGYKDSPDKWPKGTEPKPGGWYAGKQYDDDTANAKAALADIGKYYPGATKYEVVGFVFWQGEKDCGNAVHSSRYEQNLVRFIKQLRKDFNAPGAKFVLATLGEATKGIGGNEGKVLEAQLAVDGKSGKYPEFKGNVATVYSNPMARGGGGNGHYGGNAAVYMDVGLSLGQAMVDLLKNPK